MVTRVRVLTYNVQNGAGEDRERARSQNRELRRLAPDVVAFQEVGYPGGGDDPLAELVDGTGLHATHQAAVLSGVPAFAERYGGTAVATRWPHRVVEAVDQSLPGDPLPWYALAVAVPVPEDGELLFIAPTSAWRPDAEAAREAQAVRLTELDERHRATLPTVIAGDLNAGPDAASVRYLAGLQSLDGRSVHYHDAWTVAGDGPGHTWSVDNPRAAAEIEPLLGQPGHRRRIDYVFVGSALAHPRGRARIVAARLVMDQPADGVWLSDHAGVLVELEVSAVGPG
jgi:endonuclease/exonuclease/phosphatase family metal-dependent hydrolase